ncbi:MAG: hypothetical protein HRU12_13415, partial [Phaeodactylibacter sp.]|nr:hypothetical protein [Phaeodactylibacter sp.]
MATRIITSITFILLSFFISTTSTFAQCDPDTLPPTLLCNDWTVVSLSSNPDTFDLHYIIYELSDNCNDTLALTFAINGVPVDQQWPFGCPDVGEHIVEVSATDSLGNQSTCLSDLRIEDKIPAWINCQPDTMPITVYLSANDPDTLVLDEFVAEVFDFCPETPVNYHFITHLADGNSISSPTSPTFNCSMLNAVTVEAIAYDYYSGDYHTCSRTVQVLDTVGLCDTIMLTGTLFLDSIGNCLFDTAEEGLAGQEVFIQYFPYAYTQTLLTDSLGRFSSTFSGPAGQEGLFRVAPLGFPDYALSCGMTLEFPFDAGTDTVTGNLPLQLVDDCPLLTVDIGAPFLRKCQENTLTVSYCNQSLMLIENAYVEVTLEEVMAFVGSSIPLDAAANNVYTFQLGDIAPLACGSFNLNVTDLCNTTIGQTLCVEAHIYPDEICA